MAPKHNPEDVVNALAVFAGEDANYLFELVKANSEIPLTEERKKELQSPKIPHARQRSWRDDASDDVDDAIALGELDPDYQLY